MNVESIPPPPVPGGAVTGAFLVFQTKVPSLNGNRVSRQVMCLVVNSPTSGDQTQ